MRIRGGGKPADDTLPAAIRSGILSAFIRRCGVAPGSPGRAGAMMESQDLRKAGLKVTHPRMRILELLEQLQPRHMTAEDIYRQLLDHGDEIGLATVYRVLTQFEAAGLVLKHNFEGGHAVYELDRGGHHDHMVDVDTGKVIEFHSDEIEELQRRIAAKHGYEIEEHALVLYVRKKR
jgi:Fur family ferric uptake transcriptional regulator